MPSEDCPWWEYARCRAFARQWTTRPNPYLPAQIGWTASFRLTPLVREPENWATGAL
jgi:hypothetical protein